jgi:hypothetical protein
MSGYEFFAGPPAALARVSVDVACGSDGDAWNVAASLAVHERAAEAWQGYRLVCRLKLERAMERSVP